MLFNKYQLHQRSAIKEGVKIIQKIFSESKETKSFTTSELLSLAQSVPPPPDFVHYDMPRPCPPTYDRKGKLKPQPPTPSRPDHPVRSIAFLKKSILPIMEARYEIKMTSVNLPEPSERRMKKVKGQLVPDTSPLLAWKWKYIPPQQRPKSEVLGKPDELYGAAVGVGEDTGHLNKRRSSARAGKVLRAVETMRLLDEMEREQKRKQKENKEKREAATASYSGRSGEQTGEPVVQPKMRASTLLRLQKTETVLQQRVSPTRQRRAESS